MNFLDTFDVTSSPTPPPSNQPETSLNEEVQQVVGQLSRFWGGFRKQSQTVIENARKDLSEAVAQAQKELSKFSESPEEPDRASAENAGEPSPEVEGDEKGSEDITSSTSIPSGAVAPSSDDTTLEASTSQPQTLLSRLQATFPPNLVSSVQDKLPESLKHARATSLSAVDFAALRGTIAGELARVQGSSEELLHRVQGQSEELLQRVQAGDLLQRGEGLLKQVQGGGEGFLREAGEFLRDAVRIVPPDTSEGSAGVMWDGTDVWMVPTYTASTPTEGAPGEKGKGKERQSMDSVRAATRAQALLTQLRHDPQVVRADPATNPTEREAFAAWVAREIDSKGGVDGAVWSKKIEDEKSDRPELVTLLETLVPSEVDLPTFWTRYFFRVHQVERSEERRRALIQGTTDNEEDFSWEDDEDEAPAPSSAASTAQPATPFTSAPASAIPPTSAAVVSTPTASTPTTASPRQSSEGSYDVVSSQVSRTASTVNVAEAKEPITTKEKANAPEDEDDEDEDDEDDEDEEEENREEDDGEEDSDWE